MSIERLKHIKETLMCAVESQMYNLTEVDAEELGEVVDMIKDIEEALYYCAVVEAMEESEEDGEKKKKEEMMYYTPMRYRGDWESMPIHYRDNQRQYMDNGMMYYNGNGRGNYSPNNETNNTDGRDNRRNYSDGMMYYDGGQMYYNGNNSNSSGRENSSNSGISQYTEHEFPGAFQDPREGKSYRSRRMYMESKETHQDKTVQMKELEKYAQELTQDIVDMVKESTPEEKQYLSKKIAALSNKITQLNDSH